MKTLFKYILSVAILPALFACDELNNALKPGDEATPVEPIFPEIVRNDQVKPGEELEFAFIPNMDWELSVSAESFEYFKLMEDNGRQREKISGKASTDTITVRIWVNPLEELDNHRSCTLTLEMGGKSQTVAEYVRPAKGRVISIYAAKVQDGAYMTDENGAYIYEEASEITEANILWSMADAAFILPVKVIASCPWDIDRATFPSWLELNVPNETEGTLELLIKGMSLQAAAGNIAFVSGSLRKEIKVSIESCSEISLYSAKYDQGDWVYSEQGYEYTAEPQDAFAMVWTGSDIRLPIKVDSKCEWSVDMPEWITAELDDRRAGEDLFVLKCEPQSFPLDDTEVNLTFKYSGEVLKTVKLTVPGCREMISYALGMSLSAIEFNYTGQYKTSSGYMDAPLTGSVTAPTSMVMKTVEIVDGSYVQTAPEWLTCELNVDSDTDTKMVLQTKTIEVSVTENLTQTQRMAYIFLLPRDITDMSELFEEDKQTVLEAYQKYAIPVVQAFLPADYLTPDTPAEDMELEGATLIKTQKDELYECFGTTKYAYEMTYVNTWSSDVAKMYLTYPYASIEYYDADKQLVTDVEKFWINFTDYLDNKTFGAIIIPTVRKNDDGEWEDITPAAGTSYVVFKDELGATLCVVEFTYAPIIVEPEPEPDPDQPTDPSGPVPVVEDVVSDASSFFADLAAANAAGATLVKVEEVKIPQLNENSTQAEIDYAAYKKSISETLQDCTENRATLYRLTYTNSDTELVLNFTTLLKAKTRFFTINPIELAHLISVDNGEHEEAGGGYMIATSYHGMPSLKMLPVDSESAEILKYTPIVLRFYGTDNQGNQRIRVAIECVLKQ